jgi:hypothetical protein
VASAPLTAPRRVRPAELARELNVSRQAIHDLQQRGKLGRDADGLIDLELARVAVMNRVHPNGKTAQAVAKPAAAPTLQQPPETNHGETAQITSFHVARTLREAAEAKLAQLKLAELTGELVRRRDVEKSAAAAGIAIRQHLDPIADRVAAEFGADDNHRRTLRQRIRDEIDAALRATASLLGAGAT